MTQAQAIAEAVKQVLAANGAVAPKEKRTKAEMLSAKDRALKATFTKRGYKDVVLMDRDDRNKPFNVRPYGKTNPDGSKTGWIAEGRQVRKGEKGVRGLFHVSQTDPIVVQ